MIAMARGCAGGFVYGAGQDARLFDAPCVCVAQGAWRTAFFGLERALLKTPAEQLLFVPPPRVIRAAFLGDALYALCEDSNALYAYDAQAGTLQYVAPAGIAPKGFALSPCGRYIAVAGGSTGEVLILSLPALTPYARYALRGCAVAVCFMAGALYALCVTGEERGVLVRCGGGALCALPFAPCALCPFGRTMLVCCAGRVMDVDLVGKKRRVWQAELPLCVKSTLRGAYVLDAGLVMHYPLMGARRVALRAEDALCFDTDDA